MSTSMSATRRRSDARTRGRRRPRVIAVLGAAVGATTLWVAAVPIVGVDLAVTMGGRTQSIGLEPVVGVSLVAGLLGWALLAALESRTRRAAVIWTALALVVTVLSLALPLTSAAGAASGAVLVALHLLVAAILIPGLRRRAPGR